MLASMGQALGYLSSAARIIFEAIAILLLAFYWTLDGPRAIQSLLLLIPKEQRDSTRELVVAMEAKVVYYVAGQGILCLVIGLHGTGCLFDHRLALRIDPGARRRCDGGSPTCWTASGRHSCLCDCPFHRPTKLIWVIVATVIIQQLENSLLVPRVMHKAVGVNPFVSLLAIFAFSSLLGIPGALMAIPMAAIIQLLLDRFLFDPGVMESAVPVGRNYASRLRYEAQDLARDLRKQTRLTKGGADRSVKQIDQVMDEIETITTDLDALLIEASTSGES